MVGGENCSTTNRALARHRSHGTHVAGTVAADNTSASSASRRGGLRAVKILDDDGYGLLSWYVCGLDWILAARPDRPSRPLIEAANMSVTKWGADDHDCGSQNADILHQAICRVVKGASRSSPPRPMTSRRRSTCRPPTTR